MNYFKFYLKSYNLFVIYLPCVTVKVLHVSNLSKQESDNLNEDKLKLNSRIKLLVTFYKLRTSILRKN